MNDQIEFYSERDIKLFRIKERREKTLRPGYVYFMFNPETNLIKIGFTNQLKVRKSALNTSAGVTLITLGIVSARFSYEKRLHRMFASYLWSGEWFEPSDLILRYINLFTEQPRPYQIARTERQ